MQRWFLVVTVIASCLQAQGANKWYNDEDSKRPYEFGFTIDGEQHRKEKKDENGLIMGEFGFITADGVYHVTVYATDENGNFKILSMKNIRVKPYPTAAQKEPKSLPFPPSSPSDPKPPPREPAAPVRTCSHCRIPTPAPQFTNTADVSSYGPDPNYNSPAQNYPQQPQDYSQQPEFPPYPQDNSQQPEFPPYPQDNSQQPEFPPYPQDYSQQPEYPPNSQDYAQQPQYPSNQQDYAQQPGIPGERNPKQYYPETGIQPGSKPVLISAQMQLVDPNTDIYARGPGEREGLPNGLNQNDMVQLLYTFNYTVGFHGHHEEGYRNGAKKGYYYVTGRNGVRTRIDYEADEKGFRPRITQEVLDLVSEEVPKEETEKDAKYGLKGYEFKWLYYPADSKRR